MQNLQQQADKLEATINQAQKDLAELKRRMVEPVWVFKPEKDNHGWVVNGCGEVYKATEYGFPATQYYPTGNCFPTREAAELHVRKLKVIQRLKELAKGFKPDWSDQRSEKITITYGHRSKSWQPHADTLNERIGMVYFRTRGDVLNAIATLGDELNVLIEQ